MARATVELTAGNQMRGRPRMCAVWVEVRACNLVGGGRPWPGATSADVLAGEVLRLHGGPGLSGHEGILKCNKTEVCVG